MNIWPMSDGCPMLPQRVKDPSGMRDIRSSRSSHPLSWGTHGDIVRFGED